MSTTYTQQTTGAAHAGYRTLWRWHFYAALFVMPLLVVLAITGTLYCFQPQIERLLYHDRLVVRSQATPRLPANALLANARAAMPRDATPVTAVITNEPTRSAEFIFRLADNEQQSIYLNPYSGEALGTLSVEHRLMQVDRMIHRKLLLGKPGELLMELAACWTLVMIGTGVAMWWPRGQPRTLASTRDALLPRVTLRGRALWKNLHTVMGIWLALGALAFVLTGLPWSGSWGKQFKSLATAAHLGSPPGAWGGLPLRSTLPGARDAAGADEPHATHADHADHATHDTDSMPGMVMDDLPLRMAPWAAGDSRVPASAAATDARALSLGNIVALAASLGVTDDYSVVLPATSSGVYTVSYFPADPKHERTIYLDQYSGAVLKDIRYADYGAVSKAVSYGTSLHMGRYFGVANQIVCAVLSLGLAAMAVTGGVMWWKRRPARSLGAPPRERAAPPMRGWTIGLVALGIVFPLMGATLFAVWLIDRGLFERGARRVDHA